MHLRFLLLFSTIFNLHAEWNPECLNSYNAGLVNNSSYFRLKEDIKKTLIGSWCSAEKADLLMDLTLLTRPSVCVEIGVFQGFSALPVAATLKYLNSGKLYAIDAWSNQIVTRYLEDTDINKAWWAQIDMDTALYYFNHLIKAYSLRQYCTPVIESFEKALYRIPETIDFLHIDGDLSEKGCLQEVELYLPKVKPGGYILLSNFYHMIGRNQPKIKAFCALCQSCEIITTIENDNAVLFQKEFEE